MNRRFRCLKCKRVGSYKSFGKRKRRTWTGVAGWIRRRVGVHGDGICRNAAACVFRSVVPKHRRRTSTRTIGDLAAFIRP